jgi:NTE family protein
MSDTGSSTTDRVPPGQALCLSGGGYRAMLFHLGVLWRLYELGLLRGLSRISSVSGGSITAAKLALVWPKLSFDPAQLWRDFVPQLVEPIRALAGKTIDRDAILGGLLLPGTIGERLGNAYDSHLFDGATLQDLPDDSNGQAPRFVINATNVQSGVLFRFSRPHMGDWRIGRMTDPTLRLALAVAASSAFPPVLSPLTIPLDDTRMRPDEGSDLHRAPYVRQAVLCDGGVYDNLGLETAWKRCRTLFVSDAGGRMAAEPSPKEDWARHAARVLELVDSQVRALRKRQLIGAFKDGSRDGSYFGIRSDPGNFPLPPALPCPPERALELAEVPTRLKSMPAALQERLINWGYLACDLGLRGHHDPTLPAPVSFPYPEAAI